MTAGPQKLSNHTLPGFLSPGCGPLISNSIWNTESLTWQHGNSEFVNNVSFITDFINNFNRLFFIPISNILEWVQTRPFGSIQTLWNALCLKWNGLESRLQVSAFVLSSGKSLIFILFQSCSLGTHWKVGWMALVDFTDRQLEVLKPEWTRLCESSAHNLSVYVLSPAES